MGESLSREEQLANALLWIRHLAGLHYFGQAFDPEHMRSLANIASDAINGKKLPDYFEATQKAREEALKLSEEWQEILLQDQPEEEDKA